MATPREKLVEALRRLKELQDKGAVAIYTGELTRTHREILLKNGFLREVFKGWYVPADPGLREGETTSWYSSYWDFIAKFLNHKYGEDWCLSADQSLYIHAGNWSVPTQLVVRSPGANNNPTQLPHCTSVFNLRGDIPIAGEIQIAKGIQLYNLQNALIYASSAVYQNNNIDTRTALSLIRDASEVLPILLDKGHSTIGGRLAGAFRNIGRDKIADQLMDTMKEAGYDIREEDPFENKLDIQLSPRDRSPFVNRIRLMWHQMREVVIRDFSPMPGMPKDHEKYLVEVDDVYVTDAYHSLSIERYKVTPELIERVSSGEWSQETSAEDHKAKDAMAARGYYQAFGSVKETIIKVLDGANAGKQSDSDHQKWYRQLFDPSVTAGLLKVSDLAGYRNHQVYIGGSKYVLLSVDAMRDVMPIFFELLETEPEASVRAVLGHFVFVLIHPYMDGNGRMGRFLMNVMLASGGYPWTVVPVEKRDEYMAGLEKASAEQDISAFSKLLAYLVNEGLKGKPVATLPL